MDDQKFPGEFVDQENIPYIIVSTVNSGTGQLPKKLQSARRQRTAFDLVENDTPTKPVAQDALFLKYLDIQASERVKKDQISAPIARLRSGSNITPLKSFKPNTIDADDTPRTHKQKRKAVVTKELAKVKDAPSSSSESIDDDRFSVYESDSDDGEVKVRSIQVKPVVKQCHRDPIKVSTGQSLDYFDKLNQVRNLKTSDNTTASLPQLTVKEIEHLLSRFEGVHIKEKEELIDRYRSCFNQWYFELCCGYNLLFYGYGQKAQLMLKFIGGVQSDRDVLVVLNGLNPTLNYREVLLKMLDALDVNITSGNVSQLTDLIARQKVQESQYIYMIVNDMDGPSLCTPAIQSSIAKLSCANGIRLVASVSHINFGLLWDSSLASQLNFIMHDVTTYVPCLIQDLLMLKSNADGILSFGSGGTVQASNGQNHPDVKGILFVLRSLTDNARGIFKVLLEYQVTNYDHEIQQGLTYQQFYQLSRDRFLTSSDMSFRNQLTEFRDHDIIKFCPSPDDGAEIIFVPSSIEDLSRLLESVTN